MLKSYEEALEFLFGRLPMFSRNGSAAIKKGLDNITALCAGLGHPQNRFPTVHIAGTNGKGSVSHLLAAAFQHCGYKTGLYTSPHLVDFRERFRINGQLIDQAFVLDFVNQNYALITQIQPSYFELTVAMAFSAFAAENVDIAIIETGLGGRLDSTNIIRPELSVITQIGWDHMDVLGNTLAAIAGEKAGIIKENVPAVIGETQEETTPVFLEAAMLKGAPLYFADKMLNLAFKENDAGYDAYQAGEQDSGRSYTVKTDLKGRYQQANLKTALAALNILRSKGWILPPEKVVESFSMVKTLTGLHGRWETVCPEPKIILEVAHNTGGMAYLRENLRQEHLPQGGKLYILTGFVKDKDISAILKLLPPEAHYYFTEAPIPRALPAGQLYEQAQQAGLSGDHYADIHEAVEQALSHLQVEDILLVTGSFFVVGAVMPILQAHLDFPVTA
ncbi:MAG TPA: folylpolyglutamate synthase/dihydrofolate synthase family protein [Edaphocola sp.]|nr:folylpolyglutamate synthase/dihydrofolate synthase family protein [Edaphocola sp.]